MKLYHILLRFMNTHEPVWLAIKSDPTPYIHSFTQQNGYGNDANDPLPPNVTYDEAKDEYLWVGCNYSKIPCKIMAIPVKETPTFWQELKGDVKYAILSR